MASAPWRTGTVIRILDEPFNTRRFFIEVSELDAFDFKPGQFVTLDLPIHENKNKRWRSYSIASRPDGTNVFELLIVLLEGGAGTTYLFNQVQVGSQLVLRGPQGVFTLPDTIEEDVFFICTGTGIAPFRSMVHHMAAHQIPHQNIYLIFGCRTSRDLLYYEELRALENTLAQFLYLPTLSRETWEGNTGYVHGIYESICKNNTEIVDGITRVKPALFYLCGWKAMIDDARKNIAALGYDRKSVRLEVYG